MASVTANNGQARNGNVLGIAKDIQGTLDRALHSNVVRYCVIECADGQSVRITNRRITVGTNIHTCLVVWAHVVTDGDLIVISLETQDHIISHVLHIKADLITDVRFEEPTY